MLCRYIFILAAAGTTIISCTEKKTILPFVKPTDTASSATNGFLTGSWERLHTNVPVVHVFNSDGQMTSYKSGKQSEHLWWRLDSSKKENVIIFSDTKITETRRMVLDTTSNVFGMLMRSYGPDTVKFQIPILTFTKRIPTAWEDEMGNNTTTIVRRKQ